MLNGIYNMWVYCRTVWNWRWWDYGYQLRMIDKMLEECEKKYGVESHSVGDTYTKKRIQVLRRMYFRYENCETEEEDVLLKKFLKYYTRTLPRLWD